MFLTRFRFATYSPWGNCQDYFPFIRIELLNKSRESYFLFFLTFYWCCRSLSWFRALSTVFRTTLFTSVNTRSIQCTTDDVVTNTWQILHTTTADQYDRVLLQVVAFTWNVGIHLLVVRKTNTRYLTKCGVRFLRRSSVHPGAHAPALRA
ncbi:hypothetical protein SAMN04487996_109160 [Dyadobacter soli]|uniref:Uncharacterized protein n=1 Tax=Dyadobacter soli TaxID=659014 RepID=A0A1G7J1G3_9BACT|nr:hypothetical protein SAMN04487996_109160 [Dyadobacter soli]